MLAQQWWVWLGRPRWIQISTKFTIIKHNISSFSNVKQREQFRTGGPNKVPAKPPDAMLRFTLIRKKRKRRRSSSYRFNGATVIQPRSNTTVSTDRCISWELDKFPFQLTTPGRGANQLTLLSTRRVLANHIAAGIAPAELELKMSMVPYQEVQGTSQTLVWKSRAGSQPGSNAPPAGLIWPHRADDAAAAAAGAAGSAAARSSLRHSHEPRHTEPLKCLFLLSDYKYCCDWWEIKYRSLHRHDNQTLWTTHLLDNKVWEVYFRITHFIL